MNAAPPSWLRDFTDEVGNCLHPLIDAPLGCHFHPEDGIWEVTLFYAATEVVGGERDGSRTQALFWVDLRQLSEVLEIDQLHWQSHPVDGDDQLGAHVSMTGCYRGQSIWLRILANSPTELPPGQLENSPCGTVMENW